MKRTPKIILQIETTHSYGRGLIAGIVKYSQSHGPWAFFREPPFYGSKISLSNRVRHFKRLKPDGLIIREPHNIDVYLDLGIPVIVSPNKVSPQVPCIETDAVMIGCMAALHFIERGFTNFAYCGFEGIQWSDNRLAAFNEHLNAKGFSLQVFAGSVSGLSNPGGKQSQQLAAWLENLPKPAAIMCCNDDMGRIVLEICKTAQIDVPGKLAVLGVDNDELVCQLTDPPLSSIHLDSQEAGFEAAALMERLINSEQMNGQTILHQPLSVITRRSSDIYAVQDECVLKALDFIRDNCRHPIQVSDVAAAVCLSERQLFTKFKDNLNRSVHDEIKRIKTEQIKKLLAETDLSISAIAYKMGFNDPAHISRYFKQITGCGLEQYRRRER